MIREEDPRFKNLERKIGIFILIAVLGVVASGVIFGLQKDFFTSTYLLRFTVDRGTGFSKGMSVKLSGFRIGRVTSITLNELAMVDISMEIDKKYQHWIRNDSTVKLVKEGLVGDHIIEVSVGSSEKQVLNEGDNILYVKTKALDEMADEIAEKVKPVLIEIRDIIGYINNPDGDLKKTVRNIEVLSRNLELSRQNVDSLLLSSKNDIHAVSTKSIELLDSTDTKLKKIDFTPSLLHLNNTLNTIDAKTPGILDKLDTTLVNLTSISNDTKILAEKSFFKIPGILSQTEDVIFKTDRLLESLQNTWLLRDNNSLSQRPDYIHGDSHE